MTLRNRVAPDGTLHAVPSRGTLVGNRGIIHDPATRTLTRRRQTTPAWIACELSFGNRTREVWGRGWTELFFLDEVTALAAGHRPCFACRRAEARAFARAVGGKAAPSAPEMDRLIAPDRLGGGAGRRRVPAADLPALPDGAVVRQNGSFLAVRAGRLLPWGFEGYAPCLAPSGDAEVVTPRAILGALKAGYRPRWHPSAG